MTAVIQLSAPGYPARLAATPHPPAALFVQGCEPLPEAPLVVGIVGARAASRRGLDRAEALAAELAGQGAVVVSGGALGIDSAAHRGALRMPGGKTIAVLAGGLDRLYPPQNAPLFEAIVGRGGALVTADRAGTAPLPGLFVARNGVIAGLCDAVVVVEAQARSGSLQTARAAHRLGRVVGAVPGSPGCESLLAQGAALVETARDLIDACAGRPRAPRADLPEPGSREARALGVLDGREPRTSAAVAAGSGLPLRDATRALAGLEVEGLALLVAGQAYLRSPLAERLMAGSA